MILMDQKLLFTLLNGSIYWPGSSWRIHAKQNLFMSLRLERSFLAECPNSEFLY